MSRASLLIWVFFAAGCIGVLGYSYGTRTKPAGAGAAERRDVPRADQLPSDERAGDRPRSPAARPEPAVLNASMEAHPLAPPSDNRTERRPLPASADPVFALATDVSSQDPAAREAAIRALATAPPKQAISVLQEVLSSGDPRVDRPLALASLREMALDRGDPDHRIRDAVRDVARNGDAANDVAFARSAQEVLDEIESAVSRGEPRAVH